IDRYTIDGKYSQVMLSARELNPGQLQPSAQTWVNQKLVFTHGLGVTLSPVNKFTSEGLPQLLVKDLPPQSSVENLKIDRPQIYFGEGPQDYVITDTATEEFDYAKGDANVYTTYKGKGGVEIGGFFRKLLFAFRFGDVKLLLTGDISPESKILFYRDLDVRLKRIAPFITLDADPYIVISEGKLKWIQDAYTTADSFPYSTYVRVSDFKQINYIRNSVKIVMDAYDGRPLFFISDPSDPIINAYANIFPDLFYDLKQLPSDLKQHLRYPEELFKIQSRMYGTYHMKDANVFYNKEDMWAIPNEVYGEGSEVVMDPYYIIMTLPGESKEEFILMTPFTPQNKDNMIGWLAARSDGDRYGKLVVYKFPKERLIYGPMQIEARIDQDASISEQLTLWDQRGSTVIRGNLLVIPVDHSILYVEPLYLIAEKTQLPELKRVIVSDGSTVVMERDLDVALGRIFKADAIKTAAGEELTDEEKEAITETVKAGIEFDKDLVAQAIQYHRDIGESMKQGDWAGIGKNYDNLGLVLERLQEE
ncbi:TPA: COG1615 family transporter, partial [Candidatus Woesearchaeota archaeon]|nr:COG1615 family transporter [Candidatus Woesearchaeota archaeon]